MRTEHDIIVCKTCMHGRFKGTYCKNCKSTKSYYVAVALMRSHRIANPKDAVGSVAVGMGKDYVKRVYGVKLSLFRRVRYLLG